MREGLISEIIPRPGQGQFVVVPGFVDTHVHGWGGYDVSDSTKALAEIDKSLISRGTTSWLASVISQPWDELVEIVKRIRSYAQKSSSCLGIHWEGPFISPLKKGAHNPQYLLKPTVEKIAELDKISRGMVRKITFAPEVVGDLNAVVKTLLKSDILPALGHSNAEAELAQKAFDLGVNQVTHLWNAMSGVVNRQPGLVSAALVNPNVYAEVIADLQHVDPITLRLSILAKRPSRIMLVSDAIRPAGLTDGPSLSGHLAIQKQANRITLAGSDTIAGSAISLHDSFVNLIQLGYSWQDAVAMSSYSSAQAHKIAKVGQIAVGYYADLVVLKRDLSIQAVYKRGKLCAS
ncbi:N-acetylglucosamine-6-phosphate deacetylase [Mycoplasma sp. ATU-Cv-703]|uniref:N-acetylglucosamine-6-phosphate deacetylase n=1 Tax=Mycoplasma sp. ATU-Cv-703 TaxID=2498595 RepID=UPI000FDD8DA7